METKVRLYELKWGCLEENENHEIWRKLDLNDNMDIKLNIHNDSITILNSKKYESFKLSREEIIALLNRLTYISNKAVIKKGDER